MADLRVEPIEVQKVMLEAIWDGFQWGRSWPTYDFVDHTLYRKCGVSLPEVAGTCPAVQLTPSPTKYGWVFVEGDRLDSGNRKMPVGLTLAGLSRLPQTVHYGEIFLQVLSTMVSHERSVTPRPDTVVNTSIDSADMDEIISAIIRGRDADFGEIKAFVTSLITHEPATWHSNPYLVSENQSVQLSPALRNYAGISNLGQYVDRVMELVPRIAAPDPAHESSLSLPEALDYLNIKWKLRYGFNLFAERDNTTSAQLGLECSTREEFMSRCSALWTILDKAHLPDSEKATLHELGAHLLAGSDDEVVAAQITEAVDVLRATGKLRAAQQHPGTNAWKDQEWAAGTVGLLWPPSEWGIAWAKVQRRCVWALALLREEVGSSQ